MKANGGEWLPKTAGAQRHCSNRPSGHPGEKAYPGKTPKRRGALRPVNAAATAHKLRITKYAYVDV